MFDAFNAWSRLMSAGWAMTETGMRVAETMSASADVLSARGTMMAAAVRSPLRVDHAELSRMVPEKVEAFSRSGSAAVSAWWTVQSAWAAEMQHLGKMAMRGRPPTAPELLELSERFAAFGLRSVEATARLGTASIAPIHQKATSNARRLKARRAKH